MRAKANWLRIDKTLAAAFFLCWLSLCSAQDRTLRATIQPVFEGASGRGYVPYTLTIENVGQNTDAVLTVPVEGGNITYPFSLPSGSQKRVTFFVDKSSGYISAESPITIRTNRSLVPLRLPPSNYSESENVIGMVCDVSGLLGFMQTEKKSNQSTETLAIQPSYVKPENAPDRSVGYSALTALVLGEGSERLNDLQVEAIQRWAMQGGTVIFCGGANTALLNDPRWQSILPLRNVKPSTISGLNALRAYAGGQTVSGSITIVTGTQSPDAVSIVQGSTPVILTRSLGLGRVVMFAFDPFSGPMETFEGRRRLFSRFAGVGESINARNTLVQNAAIHDESNDEIMVYTPPMASPAVPTRNSTENPFKAEMPSARTIIWILISYFVLVVPVNFIVLRLLKKGELAWVTAPLISVCFAVIFFRFAAGLYKSEMATNSAGTLILDAKSPHSVFVGTTQMFFPRGGGYDLGLEQVDYVYDGNLPSDYGYGYSYMYNTPRTRTLDAMNVADAGQIVSNNMRCTNLGFYQLAYGQNFVDQGTIRLLPGSGVQSRKQMRVKVVNATKLQLKDISVSSPGWKEVKVLGSLNPGATGEITLEKTSVSNQQARRVGWLVKARVVGGLRPGPQVGREVNKLGFSLIAVPDVQGVKQS